MAAIDASKVVWDDAPQAPAAGQIDPAQVQWDDQPAEASMTEMPASMFGQPDTISALNPVQRAAVSLPKEDDGKIALLQKMGFEDVQQDAEGQIFVNGKPMKGTSFWQDFGGKLGDMVGPAMTVGGQIGAGLAAAPAAIASGPGALPIEMGATAAGGMLGDVARQGALNMIEPGAGFDAGQTLEEGALGATAPIVGAAASHILKPVMKPLAAGMSKAMRTWGAGFPNWLQMQTGIPEAAGKHIMQRAIRDDVKIIEKSFEAVPLSDIASRTLLGLKAGVSVPGDEQLTAKLMATQAEKLGKGSIPLFQDYLGIDQESTNWLIDRGAQQVFSEGKIHKGYMLKIATHVNDNLKGAINRAGSAVREARYGLFQDRGGNVSRGAKVAITDLNQNLATELVDQNMLIKVGKGYQINPEYKNFKLSESDKQTPIFNQLMKTFFKKSEVPGEVSERGLTRLNATNRRALENVRAGTATKEEVDLISNLEAVGSLEREPAKTIYIPDNSMTMDEFVNKLNILDSKITYKDFKNAGELSPSLAKYIGGNISPDGSTYQGLRGKVIEVAKAAGDTRLPNANYAFTNLKGIEASIGGLKKDDLVGVESWLRSLLSKNAMTTAETSAKALDFELNKVGYKFLDDLRDYDVAQKLVNADAKSAVNSMTMDLNKVFIDNPRNDKAMQALSMADDMIQNKNLKFMTAAKDSKSSEWVSKKATNMMRMLFQGRAITKGAPMVNQMGAAGNIATLGAGYYTASPTLAGRKMLEFATSPLGRGMYKAGLRANKVIPGFLGDMASNPVPEAAVSRAGASALGSILEAKQKKQAQ